MKLDIDTLKVVGPIIVAVLGVIAVMLKRKQTIEYRHVIDMARSTGTSAPAKKKSNFWGAAAVIVLLLICCGWWGDKQNKEELSRLTTAAEAAPYDAAAQNALAWFLATCGQSSYRDGSKAIEHATKACELTAWANAQYVDTLAAAYAESGDFTRAVEWQEKAMALDGGLAGASERLASYRQGKPTRS